MDHLQPGIQHFQFQTDYSALFILITAFQCFHHGEISRADPGMKASVIFMGLTMIYFRIISYRPCHGGGWLAEIGAAAMGLLCV